MSAKVVGQVWELDIPHAQAWVLMALADHADHEGNNVRPSIGLIAWKTNYSERTVQRIMAELRATGILKTVRADAGSVKEYSICFDSVPRKAARFSDDPCQNVTPDKMSPLTQLCQGRGDTAMSPRTVIEPINTHTAHETQTATIAQPSKPDVTTSTVLNAQVVKTPTVPRIDKPQASVLFTAICEVCEREPDPDALTTAALKRMPELQRWLRAQCPELNDVELSAELHRRFDRPNWTFDDPPQFSQLRDLWAVQGNRLNRPAQTPRRYADNLNNLAALRQKINSGAAL